jgi:formamidopyrimidine-DNA glycosylase
MPELPEVQTTVNGLRQTIIGLHIVDAWSDYNSPFYKGSDNIKDPKYFKKFKKEVIGRKIVSVERRAKNILINLNKSLAGDDLRGQNSGDTILIHLKMTGHLLYGKYVFEKGKWRATSSESLKDPFNSFIHFILKLSNGEHLALSDMRKFAKVALIDFDLGLSMEGTHESSHLKDIGPEPLADDFKVDDFLGRLKVRPNGKIKQVLLDQSIIAGIGNIYADEALWYAGIHPAERVKALLKYEPGGIHKKSQLKKPLSLLYRSIRKVLSESIKTGGSSISDYRNIFGERGKSQERHRAYQMTGQKCAKKGCGGTIRRIVVAGRGTHFCDRHQKLGLE